MAQQSQFAVIATGGKQYTVREGDSIKVEKLLGEVGGEVVFSDVLLRANEDGSFIQIGTPFLEGALVAATILEQGRAKKVTVIKYKPKVRYRRKKGHRQAFTKIQITKIS